MLGLLQLCNVLSKWMNDPNNINLENEIFFNVQNWKITEIIFQKIFNFKSHLHKENQNRFSVPSTYVLCTLFYRGYRYVGIPKLQYLSRSAIFDPAEHHTNA